MATSIITNTITDPSGNAIANVKIICRLIPCAGFRLVGATEVTQRVDTITDGNGVYSLTLEQNSNIVPDGTHYEIEERIPPTAGGAKKWNIAVGVGNQTVSAAQVSVVPTITTPSYLTQAAADARYVIAPGSFAAVGTLTDSRPSDVSAAGVATTYTRGDHKHSRETIYGTAAARAALSAPDPVNGQQFLESDTLKWYDRIAAAWKQITKTRVDTAANAPATNFAGQSIYVTDATNIAGTGIYTPDATSQPARGHNVWWWNGTRWQYGEWGKPWGVVGYIQITGDVNFTTLADIAGLTLTFTAAANRRIKITAYSYRVVNGTTDNESAFIYIREGATKLQTALVSEALKTSLGGGNPANLSVVISPTAGSHTYVVSAERAVGSNTHTYSASATAPGFLLIEDIGPNGAPA